MMSNVWNWTRAKLLIALGVGLLTAPVWGANAGRPGTINYVEGNVTLNGAPLNSTSIGVAELQPGQMLETQQGKAEMLLTPGVFIRLDDNSRLRMIAPDLTNTRVELVQGKAMLEATQILKDTQLNVVVAGSTTTVQKPGLYEFDANQPELRVYDGQASVLASDHRVKVKKGRETALAGVPHAQKFDRSRQDSLYAWSNVRSQTLAEAAASYARTYVAGGGYGFPGWYGAGWYWNPWFDMYSFVPGYGIYYSPFGWPYYSPGFIGYAPLYFGVYGHVGHVYPRGHWGNQGHWGNHPSPGIHSLRGGHGYNAFRGGHSFSRPAIRGGGGFHGGFRGGFHGGGSRGHR